MQQVVQMVDEGDGVSIGSVIGCYVFWVQLEIYFMIFTQKLDDDRKAGRPCFSTVQTK